MNRLSLRHFLYENQFCNCIVIIRAPDIPVFPRSLASRLAMGEEPLPNGGGDRRGNDGWMHIWYGNPPTIEKVQFLTILVGFEQLLSFGDCDRLN